MQPAVVKFAVRKPIDEVFNVISDIARYNEWAPQSSSVYYGTTITSGITTGLHTTYEDRMLFGGKSAGKITRYEPPSRFTMEQTSALRFPLFSACIDYQLFAKGQMTTVIHTVTPKTHGIYELVSPMHQYLVNRERNRFARAIVQRLEIKDRAHR